MQLVPLDQKASGVERPSRLSIEANRAAHNRLSVYRKTLFLFVPTFPEVKIHCSYPHLGISAISPASYLILFLGEE